MYRKPKPAFYLRWWFIILMLVLIFPLGLVLIICRVVWEVHQPKVEQIHPQRRNPGDYNFQPPQRSAPMSAPTPERATRFTLPQIPPRAADYQLPERELYTWRGLYDQLPPGTRLYFADEGDAVRAYNSNGVRGGEVPHGTLERLLSLCLSRGDVVVGEVVYYDGYSDLRAIIDIFKAYPYTDLDELAPIWANAPAIGDKIRLTRQALGLRQEDAAPFCLMSASQLGRWERAEIAEPRPEELRHIAEGLRIDYDELLRA